MRQINVAYQDLKENMVNLINHAGVPMFMVQELLELIQNKVTLLAAQELEQARQKEKEEAEKQRKKADDECVKAVAVFQKLADARQKEMEENASKQSDSPAVESTEQA